jgi:N-acetyllactosaminide beta-1,3-N-acetylglucosaminyltransferase
MPIFEVRENCSVPETKEQLLDLVKKKDAIPFHAQVCQACHRFPMRDAWMKASTSSSDDVQASGVLMSVLGYATRTGPYRSWEPIYVGTNAEPPYDERLSWEGKKDKMTQVRAQTTD